MRIDAASLLPVLLKNRGIDASGDLSELLSPTWASFHDPYLLDGMEVSVQRILRAKDAGERVVIFGDYDVDGVSSTALLVRLFTRLGIEVSYRLPHRVKDGYGMKAYFMDELSEKGVKLVISVDCGTKDIDAIRHAKSLGIDVIVTDHHSVPQIIPEEVVAILNPKIPTTPYPFHFLSGSGVAWKLGCALLMKMYPNSWQDIALEHIEYAALWTVADCMPLIGENRAIVQWGLERLASTGSVGLRRLATWKDTSNADIIGFQIGPRLNAAGRMDSPYRALELLLAGESRMDEILATIETLNEQRKASTLEFTQKALLAVDPTQSIIVYASDEMVHGVAGLVAARLAENFGRPAIALVHHDGRYVASCRSIEGIDIVELLDTCKDLFIAYGGHKQAAGFSVSEENFAVLMQRLQSIALTSFPHLHTSTTSGRSYNIDGELPISDLSLDMLSQIEMLRPYGIGFPRPVFVDESFSPKSLETFGTDGAHLRLVSDRSDIKITAWRMGSRANELKEKPSLRMVYELERDSWHGRDKIGVIVREIG